MYSVSVDFHPPRKFIGEHIVTIVSIHPSELLSPKPKSEIDQNRSQIFLGTGDVWTKVILECQGHQKINLIQGKSSLFQV